MTPGSAPRNQSRGNAVKVALEGPYCEVERLWATPLGNNLYRLDNLSWYAYRVSLEDVVEALPDDAGYLRVQRVVVKSGNRTIRVILAVGEHDRELTFESARTLAGLVALGCSREGANKRLLAVNVPPSVSLWSVAEFQAGSDFEWEHADPPHEDLLPGAVVGDEPATGETP